MAKLCFRYAANDARHGVTVGMDGRSGVDRASCFAAAVMLMLWPAPGVALAQASGGTGAPAPIGRDDPSTVPPSHRLPVPPTWTERVKPRRSVAPISPTGNLCRWGDQTF